MNKILLNACLATLTLSTAFAPASAQQKTEATPIWDAMQTAISADPRVNELKALDPEDLVSEAAYAIEWPKVHERDVFWKCRLLRTIDIRDERNMALKNIENSKKDFATVLVSGALSGLYKVYGDSHMYPTTELSSDSLQKLLADYPSGSISKFIIKQDWLYLGYEHKLVGRIVALAPVREIIAADGTTTDQPLFWLYHPSTREYLREHSLSHSGHPEVHNLDELFELMKFSSTITSARQSDQTKTLDFLTPEKREHMLKNF